MTLTDAQRHIDGGLEIDPTVLAAHPANIRRATGDITGLKTSIEQLGILQPIVVIEVNDGYQVLAGHRRLAAALELTLPTVPIRVVHLDNNPAVLAMVTENVQRKDLTVGEEAEAYLQLQAAGLDVEAIAKQTGMATGRVQAGLTVAGSKTAAAVVAKHELSLDQALVVAEFDSDKEAIKRLTVTAVKEPGQFDHVASRLRADAKLQADYDDQVAKLQAAGVTLLKKGAETGYMASQANCALRYLLNDQGKELTAAKHKTCPGHAAVVRTRWDGVEVTYVCTSAKKHGHKGPYDTRGVRPKADLSDAEREKAKVERRAVIENNKAWKAATPVRRAFVKALLERKTAPKALLRVAAEMIGDSVTWAQGGTETILKELTGHSGGTGYYNGGGAAGQMAMKGTDAQLPLAFFALVAGAAENDFATANRPYESRDGKHQRYLQALVENGYTLAPVEALIAKATATA